jgi:hypothetical protein
MFFLGKNESFRFFQSLFPAVGFIGPNMWMFISQKEIPSQLSIPIEAWRTFTHMKHLIFGSYTITSVFGACDKHLSGMRDCVQL